ncbi:MAG: UDP-N-acetylmuramoyl-L-alanyl-D-glutamate--2,6-diaminopimelate ligase [Chloroflexi bacterium]|nr:UDP-N-acetylmuramoyl-L-alanyl-D-glutamate--2,6-diaminopimelate ligase [Chloroflexota bacterium]
MKLSDLLQFLHEPVDYTGPDPEITGIAHDSRRVRPGHVFVAVWHPGYAADRHEFAAAAAAAGAAAVVVQRPVDVPAGTPVVVVRHTPSALGRLAAGFYGVPSARLGLAGVTGTDGKTTTCTLIADLLEASGIETGMATTVASKGARGVEPNRQHTSTPEAVEIQALLAEVVAAGGRCAVLEATSHALDQDRLTGCEIDVAVVTRVTHEHLEYHGTRERYLAAKARLLDLLRPNPRHPKQPAWPKATVLNADDGSHAYLAHRSPAPVIRYAVERDAEVRASDVRSNGWDTTFHLRSPWGERDVALCLPGVFNVYNALAASAAACTLGASLDACVASLAAHPGVTGRMERIECGQPFKVVVDFAHTPDALRQVLTFLRPITPGKLIVVFGSAGERDREKRPMQGRVAAELADYSILTEEDSRLEDRDQIIAEIAAGALAAGAVEGRQFERVPDRREAIGVALRQAAPGDTVLLAGKGHENSIIGARDGRLDTIAWDEREVARGELRKLGYGS